MKKLLVPLLLMLGVGASVYFLTRSDESHPEDSLTADSAAHPDYSVDPLQSSPRQSTPLAQGSFQVQRLQGRAYTLSQSFEAPVGDAAQVVARFLPLAERGDEVASFQIYMKISSCRNGYDRARADAPNTDPVALVPEECRSIPMDQWRSYTSRWLEASADSGFVPAQLTYAADPGSIVGDGSSMLSDPEAVATYRRKAMAYLKRAASTGNVEALQKLALSYANGILTKRDPMQAYAYIVAANEASRSVISPELALSLQQKYASGLTSSQLGAATQQGRKIYEECCSP